MKMIFILSLLAHAGDVRLINGKVANKADWPASLKAGGCTSTVIGPRTLLIAAHCIRNNGKVSVAGGYSAVCTHHPDYRSNKTADWALCLLNKEVTGVPFEHINVDPTRVRMGDTLTLTGYGCTKKGGGGTDGNYRTGESKVIRLPSTKNHDIVTKGGAALCYGDSGGPAFLVDADNRHRWVVSVNSRGNISTTSYLSSVANDKFQDFLKSWTAKHEQKVCGVDSDLAGCR